MSCSSQSPSKKRSTSPLLLTLLALLTMPRIGVSEILSLEPGNPVQGVLESDALHVYEAHLPKENSWRLDVTVERNQAFVEVHWVESASEEEAEPILAVQTLFGLGWNEVLTFTGPRGRTETEALARITLRPLGKGAPVGSYSITLTEISETTPKEQQALLGLQLGTQAMEHFTDAVQLQDAPAARQEHLLRAEQVLQEALGIWRNFEQPQAELRVRMAVAEVLLARDEPSRAARTLAESLPLATSPALASTRALLLDRLGYVHLQQGDLDRAQSSFEEARVLWRRQNQPSGQLRTRANLCTLYQRQGQWSTARSCYEEFISAAGSAGEPWLVAKLEASLGGVYANLGEPDLAIRHYQNAVDLAQKLDKPADEATVLNNFGALHRALGELDEAIDLYQRALEFFRRRGDAYSQARTLNNLGYAHLSLGNLERAHPFFQEALTWRRTAGDRRGEAITLRNLGRVAVGQGQLEGAEAAFRAAIKIARDLADPRGEATGTLLLGTVFHKLGERAAARESFDRALSLRRDLGHRPGIAEALLARGRFLLEDADTTTDLEEALTLYREIRDPTGQIEALQGLAQANHQAGQLETALRHGEEALALLETLRIRIADPSRQASFLAAQRGVFETLIETSMALHRMDPSAGHATTALEVSERARARTLLDLLEEPILRDDKGIDPTLRTRWQSARRQLADKAQRQLRLLGRGATGEAAISANQAVRDALTELETVQAQIRRSNPRFETLGKPQTLSAEAIQRLLDPETVLLEIALGKNQSFLWLVTQNTVRSFELPPRELLEGLARQAHQELTQLDLRTRRTRREASQELARWVLGPVAEHLTGQRVVVVADGALHYVPFATLPLPGTAGRTPLIDRFEVIHLPSASALSSLRPLLAAKTKAPRTTAVLADPVFSARDPRLSSSTSGTSSRSGLRDLQPESLDFDRLPQSREEALAIAASVPPGEVLPLLGFEARRDRVLGGDLDHHAILHFATHAMLHPQHAELSGLVLSQVDAEGRPLDGFLRLHDLLGLDLGADLVVLSGCQTALGRELSGEGFMGLARGFFHAGVPRLVASLWQVHDEATAWLMERFYHAHLTQGKAPSTALREAQLALRSERRFADPFYWGAFIYQGDWR